MKRVTIALLVLIGLTFGIEARANNYDEGVNGDLSGDRFAPTVITLTAGSNLITATSVSGDREYYTFTVPPNHRLTAVVLTSYTSLDALAFIGIQTGMTFTEPPTGTVTANLLGYTHFGTGNSTVGTDVLDNMGTGAGAMGFVPPLPVGPYALWSQQTGANPATYTFDFQVVPLSSVPALSDAMMLLLIAALGVAALLVMRRRRMAAPPA